MKVWTVYKITCANTGLVYVGCTSRSPRVRLIEHISAAHHPATAPRPFQEDLVLFGAASFTVETVSQHYTRGAGKAAEREHIEHLGAIWPSGYNLNSESGAGKAQHSRTKLIISSKNRGAVVPLERRLRISAATKGVPKSAEARSNMSRGMKGIPKSEEGKQKMRLAKLGKKQAPEHVAKVKATKQRLKEERLLHLVRSAA